MVLLEKIFEYLEITGSQERLIESGKILLITLILALTSYLVTQKIIMKFVIRIVRKTKTKWDDYFINRGLFSNFSILIPLMIFQILLKKETFFSGALEKIIKVGFIIAIIRIIQSIIYGLEDIYETYNIAKEKPIKSYIQVINIFIIFSGLIIFIALLFDKSPLTLLSGIGAMTAIILLVFKDALLGFVASIQLAANNLVSLGDWIEMPSQGADGKVVEINLTNVKIQNWDKTIVTIPSYSLVSQSFKNWKGMENSGGRRIKRTINIDINSIKFLDIESIENLKKSKFLKEYLELKEKEMNEINSNELFEINTKKITNIGTFRIYLENFLKVYPYIDTTKPILVRQGQSNQFGLPLEIYCFANVVSWTEYEKIQSDIFDHLIAIIGNFELNIFQSPNGVK